MTDTHRSNGRIPRTTGVVLAMASAIVLASSCTRPMKDGSKAERRILNQYSVAASPGAIGAESQIDAALPPSSDENMVPGAVLVAESNNGSATTPTPPAPPLPAADIKPGDEIVADSLVGQINGRPIFANSFFAPIDARLRTFREQLTSLEFDQALMEAIGVRLQELVQSELLLSTAQSRLTDEQQQGLFRWLQEQQDRIEASGGGTRESAQAQLRDEFGGDVTIEDLVDDRKKRMLVQMIYEQEIAPRISVSWRDIERRYQQKYAEFNPPGRARIERIWIDRDQSPQQVDAIQQRIDNGESFSALVEELGTLASSNWYNVPAGGLGASEDFIELFRTQLAELELGQTTQPFELTMSNGSTRIVWLHIAELDSPPGRSIYEPEVQLALRAELEREQRRVEESRYFREHLAEDILTDVNALGERLFAIGQKRYRR
ncbi:MAG: hypothetical protein ACR2GY_03575 [Phycisphaerales bacterium]